MNDPTEFVWKILEIVGLIGAFILWALKQQSNKTKSDGENERKFNDINKMLKEQEKHIEFQDDKIENFSDKLDRISQQISQFGVFDLRIKQLENENIERKEENKTIVRKLDGIFNKMNQIELNMSNKQNRPL